MNLKWITIIIICLSFSAFAKERTKQLPRQTEGMVGYYVDHTLSTVFLEMPLLVEYSLVEVDADQSFASVSVRRQTRLQRGEIDAIRKRYPAYQLSSFDGSARVLSADISFPGVGSMEVSIAPSREPIIDATEVLSGEIAKQVRSRLQRGEKPSVRVQLRRVVPAKTIVESVTVPVGRTCNSLRRKVGGETTTGTAIRHFIGEFRLLLASVRERDTAEDVFSGILRECVELSNASRFELISDLMDLPVRVNSLAEAREFFIEKTKSSEVNALSEGEVEFRRVGE